MAGVAPGDEEVDVGQDVVDERGGDGLVPVRQEVRVRMRPGNAARARAGSRAGGRAAAVGGAVGGHDLVAGGEVRVVLRLAEVQRPAQVLAQRVRALLLQRAGVVLGRPERREVEVLVDVAVLDGEAEVHEQVLHDRLGGRVARGPRLHPLGGRAGLVERRDRCLEQRLDLRQRRVRRVEVGTAEGRVVPGLEDAVAQDAVERTDALELVAPPVLRRDLVEVVEARVAEDQRHGPGP